MPGSFEPQENPHSLLSSLRSFRFNTASQSNPKSSHPNHASDSSDCSKNTKTISRNLPTRVCSVHEVVSTNSYSSLSRKSYKVSSNPNLTLSQVLTKIQETLDLAAFDVVQLELKLNCEEFKKIKDVIQQNTKLSKNWSKNTFLDEKSLSNIKTLKINSKYLKDVQNFLSSLLVKDASINEANALKPPTRTYSRQTIKTSSSVSNKVIDLNKSCPPIESYQLEQKKSKGIMDEYEVFCGKELNLRKLLDAFPGADIMEAQDILVRCDWNLQKAMSVATEQALRCPKNRSLSSGQSSSKSVSGVSNTKAANTSIIKQLSDDEIILDSSDEESIGRKPKSKAFIKPIVGKSTTTPAPKRVRRISSSDSEDSLSAPKITVSQNKDESVTPKVVSSHLTTMLQNISDKKEKSFTISSASDTKKINNDPMTNPRPVPNLPKGLMIMPIAGDEPLLSNVFSQTLNNGVKENSVLTVKKDSLDAKLSTSCGSKSPQLVRISSSANVTDNQINVNYKIQNKATLNIIPLSKDITIHSDSKGVSILPVGKEVSIIPVAKPVSNILESSDSCSTENRLQNNEKSKKRKKMASDEDEDEDYGNDLIFDSDDSDVEDNLTSAHIAVLKFFQESTTDELGCVPGCSKKKVEAVINARPFNNWTELVAKLSSDKFLSTDLLNGAKKVMDMRSAINKLMSKCQQISIEMEDLVENLKENKEKSSGYIAKQPELLNGNLSLTSYQMLGINWLHVMHNQEVNGILADEMGLGKTIQAIAFLAYLKEVSISGPHLIVVPSSVLDNWKLELESWWPNVSIICYHGSQDSRRELRLQILNDEVEEFDVMITTYNMVTKGAEDRGFFKRLEFHYVVFDEAHMLKNMASQRYQQLMKIKAPRRLLLTGTPLQNNLVELMSLLIFAMPHMFSGKTDHIKQMFSAVSKIEGNKTCYEKDRIEHAKRIMKPFILRRLKKDVLQDLPKKYDETKYCIMLTDQAKKYEDLVERFSAEVQRKDKDTVALSSGAGMMMQLRRAANHPLLLRRLYTEEKLEVLFKDIQNEPNVKALPNLEDMYYMSDFELHRLCKSCKSLKSHILPNDKILASGKFKVLDELLPDLIGKNHRVLLFSQFTMVLDIIEEYMDIMKYKFLRLDGQIPVIERQDLINTFNKDSSIFVFLLSTKAGGLGINLTAADTVILHDIDFNPYNDKQAEDRCHRVGQTKAVTVIRFISKNTIEEGILQRATEKLKLEQDIHEVDENGENDPSVAKLLRDALGIKNSIT